MSLWDQGCLTNYHLKNKISKVHADLPRLGSTLSDSQDIFPNPKNLKPVIFEVDFIY